MKNNFLLRNEFMEWLVNIAKYPLPSAKSYCSYVAAVYKTLIFTNEETPEESNLSSVLEPAVKTGEFSVVDSIILNVINQLSAEHIEQELNVPLSSIQKWKSALFQYIEFLSQYIDTEISVDDQTEDSIELKFTEESPDESEVMLSNILKKTGTITKVDFIHTKNDLYSNFRFRLITQDRFYDEIFYPISFIKRFLYLKGEKAFLDAWVESLLDNVTIHFEDSSMKLKVVKKIEISEGRIIIHANGSSKIAFTKKSDNLTLIPFSVTGLNKVALDHEKPLLKIMQDNLDNLKTFQEITKELKKNIHRKVNPKRLKKASNLVLMSDFIHLIDIANLKSEMTLLSSLTQLQLMDGSENKRKGIHH